MSPCLTAPVRLPEGEGVEGKLSKKKLKLLNRLKVAELKAVCARPEVVEVWDVTGPDPPLLVFLKVGGGPQAAGVGVRVSWTRRPAGRQGADAGWGGWPTMWPLHRAQRPTRAPVRSDDIMCSRTTDLFAAYFARRTGAWPPGRADT